MIELLIELFGRAEDANDVACPFGQAQPAAAVLLSDSRLSL
jgi:hypothetical protein